MSKMFTIALIGPDGAGKSSIARQLARVSPLPIKYVYMGVNLESSNLVLPTTRLLLEVKRARGQRPDMAAGPHDPDKPGIRPASLMGRLVAGLRAALRFMNMTAEEWFRQLIVWNYIVRGYSVIFDRHFYFDYYAHDIANENPNRPLSSRIHGFMLEKLYPKPDFVIFLDAPAEVLFARKPEGRLEALELRRQEYIQMRKVARACAVVDVSKPMDQVMDEVNELIVQFHRSWNRMDPVKQW